MLKFKLVALGRTVTITGTGEDVGAARELIAQELNRSAEGIDLYDASTQQKLSDTDAVPQSVVGVKAKNESANS